MADPIVLGYDESPSANAALAATIRIAPIVGAKVVVVFGYYISPLGGLQHGSIEEALEGVGRHAVGRAVADLEAAGVEVESRLVSGKPADVLIDVAKEVGASAIVVGTVGENPVTGAILGSVVLRLVQRSPLPILVVPDRAFRVTAVGSPVEIDRTRIRELTEREAARLDERTPESKAMYERARRALAGGVGSSYQVREPWPIYVTHGEGPRVWDVDGTEYLDFHNGFGAMTQGHAHPAVTRAVQERAALGTHFAAPTEDGILVAEELARRFRLPKWRYTNSGSEATMDAIRIARAYTGPRHRAEDLRLVPRPPRRRDGLDRRRVRPDRRPRRSRLAALRCRDPAGPRRPDGRRALQRRRRDGAPDRPARRRGTPARLSDHGGGDDEPRGRAPRARLPRGRARAHRPPRDRPDLRRGEDRPDAGRRRCRRALRRRPRPASRWRRRSARGFRRARSAAPTR